VKEFRRNEKIQKAVWLPSKDHQQVAITRQKIKQEEILYRKQQK
jgi:hypothetical protein